MKRGAPRVAGGACPPAGFWHIFSLPAALNHFEEVFNVGDAGSVDRPPPAATITIVTAIQKAPKVTAMSPSEDRANFAFLRRRSARSGVHVKRSVERSWASSPSKLCKGSPTKQRCS